MNVKFFNWDSACMDDISATDFRRFFSKFGSAIAIDLVIDFKDNTRNVQLVSLN